jgi:hypothetical protein
MTHLLRLLAPRLARRLRPAPGSIAPTLLITALAVLAAIATIAQSDARGDPCSPAIAGAGPFGPTPPR